MLNFLRNGIPSYPFLCGVIKEVARIGGTKLIVVPALIVVCVYQGEVFSIGEDPSANWIVDPSVDERSFSDFYCFFQVIVANG